MCVKCEEAKGILEEFIASGPSVLREHGGHHAATAMLELAIRSEVLLGAALTFAETLPMLVARAGAQMVKEGLLSPADFLMDRVTAKGEQVAKEMVDEGLVGEELAAKWREREQQRVGDVGGRGESEVEVVV